MCLLLRRCEVCDRPQIQGSSAPGNKGQTRCSITSSTIGDALGVSLGHLNQSTVGLVTLVGSITISASTYMILYSHELYARLGPYLGWFERKVAHREMDRLDDNNEGVDVLLSGLGRFGSSLANMLRERGCRLLTIDFAPAAVRLHEREGYHASYGDAEDPEFIATLPLESAMWVVSTLRDRALNRTLLQGLQQQGFRGKVAVSSSTGHEAEGFRQNGADLVLVPYADAAKEAADKLVRECLQHNDIPSLGVGV